MNWTEVYLLPYLLTGFFLSWSVDSLHAGVITSHKGDDKIYCLNPLFTMYVGCISIIFIGGGDSINYLRMKVQLLLSISLSFEVAKWRNDFQILFEIFLQMVLALYYEFDPIICIGIQKPML